MNATPPCFGRRANMHETASAKADTEDEAEADGDGGGGSMELH